MDDHISSLYVLGTALVYCLPAFIALARGHPTAFHLGRESLVRMDTARLDGRVALGANEAT